jgi:multicomponent Na+:H+ antiporter subunit E
MQKQRQLFRVIIALAILWLLLSGMFKAQQLILGVISIAIVAYLSAKMKVLNHRGQPLYFRFDKVVKYSLWLALEILKSNIDVVRRIFTPSLPIDPILKNIPSEQRTELGRVSYANSITLTPGTVAINIASNRDVLVHALDKAAIEELENGDMGNKVCELEPVLERDKKTNP